MVEESADILEEITDFASLVEPTVAQTPLERAVARRLSARPTGAEALAAGTRLPLSCVERALGERPSKEAELQDERDLHRIAAVTAGR